MKIKHLPIHLGLAVGLAISGVVFKTPQAQAQSGNFSDITGTIVTTSDMVGGFSPGGDRRIIIAFRTSAIGNAVNQAAVSINQQLAARNLPVPVVATGTPSAIPESIQQNCECVLTGTGDVGACATQLENDLINAGANPIFARNLVSSFQGLTAGGSVNPERLLAAVRAYNALIESNSTVAAFSAESLRASQSVLAILLNAALGR
jgi:hypothetical protein